MDRNDKFCQNVTARVFNDTIYIKRRNAKEVILYYIEDEGECVRVTDLFTQYTNGWDDIIKWGQKQ